MNISPLFLQARHPSLIEFDGPVPKGFAPINLPDNFDDMSKEDQQSAKDLRAAQSIYKLYEIFMLEKCPEVARAMTFKDSLPGQITGLASSIFSDGEPVFQGMLIQLHDEWTKWTGLTTPCPLTFTREDRSQQVRLQQSWSEGVELMAETLTEIGAYQGWDGWVNHNNYPVYKERLKQCRDEFLDHHAKTEEERNQWVQAWPFQDKTST